MWKWLAGIFCAWFVIPAASALNPGEFEIAGWIGKAEFDGKAGAFDRCWIASGNRDGSVLMFLIDRNAELAIVIRHADWQLETGSTYPVRLSIDDFDVGNLSAYAYDHQGFILHLGHYERLLTPFRRGRVLRLEPRSDPFSYGLTGTAAALPRLVECWRARQAPPRATLNPLAAPPTAAPLADESEPKIDLPFGSIGKVAEWYEMLDAVYEHIGTALGYCGDMGSLADDVALGDVSPELGAAKGKELSIRAGGKIRLFDELRPRLDDMIADEAKLRDQMGPAAVFLDGLRAKTMTCLRDVGALLDATIEGRAENTRVLARNHYNVIIDSMKAESDYLGISRSQVRETHPQRFLYDTIIASNNAIVEILSIVRDSEDNGALAADRLDTALAEAGIATAMAERGREATDTAIDAWRNARILKAAAHTALIAAMETYYDSFDTEIALGRTITDMIHGMEEGRDTSEHAGMIEVLVDRRMSLQSTRRRLIATVARR